MRYNLPSLNSMRQKGNQLRLAYKKSNRSYLIELYDALQVHVACSALPEQEERGLLLAGLILMDELVKKEYWSGNAAISSSWLLKPFGGSTLATIIENQLLEITPDNQLGDDERLIYVNKLYHYLNDHVHDNLLGNKTKNGWLLDIIGILKVLRQRNDKQLGKLQESTPALETIQHDLNGLRNKYQDWGNKTGLFWKPNNERESALGFIQSIAESCIALHGGDISSMSEQQYYQAQETISGAVLYRAMRIAHEYSLHSPAFKEGYVYNSGSRLFSLFLDILNVKCLSEISPELKIAKLEAVVVHLNIMLQPFNKNVDIDQLATLKDEINSYIALEKDVMNKPSYLTQAVASGVGLAVRHTAPFLLTKVIAVDLLMPLIGRGIFAFISGPVGLVIFGASGMLITSLDRFATSTILPRAQAGIFAYVISKLSQVVGNNVASAVAATGQGLQALMKHESLTREDKDLIDEWVNTLLTLPDEVFSPAEKKQVRKITGIQEILQASLKAESSSSQPSLKSA